MPMDPTQLAGAFDHVVALLLNQSGQGPVRREAVDRLVTVLRKDGRGSEALAAELLFRMVDYVDHEKTTSVTPERLAFARGYLGRKLASGLRDPAAITPTLRALVEVAAVLNIAARPGRVAYRVPEQGMAHTAALLKAQADERGNITRAERDLLVYELYEQGRGAEALAARYLFNFTDHRTPEHDGWFTGEALDATVEYAREKLLRQKDANHNGYSAEEINHFSTTALSFLRVGQMIEAGLVKNRAA